MLIATIYLHHRNHGFPFAGQPLIRERDQADSFRHRGNVIRQNGVGDRMHEMILAREEVKSFDASQRIEWFFHCDQTSGHLP